MPIRRKAGNSWATWQLFWLYWHYRYRFFFWVYNKSNSLYEQDRLGDSVVLLIVVVSPSTVLRTLLAALRWGLAAATVYVAWWAAKKGLDYYNGGDNEETNGSKDYRYGPEEDSLFVDANDSVELAPLIA